MAYVSQELKKSLAPAIKAVLTKYGMRGTIGVRHHSTLVVRLSEGSLDLIGDANSVSQREARYGDRVHLVKDYFSVNVYHIKSQHSGECAAFLTELHHAMMRGNHDRSDVQVDHFDVGWYTDIRVGAWDKPYKHTV